MRKSLQEEGENERSRTTAAHGKMAASGKVCLCGLRSGAAFLLDLPLRFHDLLGLHGGKFLGNDL
jgi:hypothetical protein